MSGKTLQRGVALFTAVFLIAAVAVLAASVSLIAGQQQLTSAQSLDQTRAYYAARARLDQEIAALLGGSSCAALGPPASEDTFGFATAISACSGATVDEGGMSYQVFDLGVSASRGSLEAGTLVRRTVRVQITDAP